MEAMTRKQHLKVVGAARAVYRRLGSRFPVEQYEEELTRELMLRGIGISDRKNTRILFGGMSAGVYLADIILDGRILIEIKRTKQLTEVEKSRFGSFIENAEYQRGYLMNLAGDGLEVEIFPAE